MGNTRMGFCRCAPTLLEGPCLEQCLRPPSIDVILPDSVWKPMLLREGTGLVTVGGDFNPTLPLQGMLINAKHTSSRPNAFGLSPSPANRELAWHYWSDLPTSDLPAVVANTNTPISSPLVWSWTRNYFTTAAPPPDAVVSNEPEVRRRQDLKRFQLVESTAPFFDVCAQLVAGVLPARAERIPNMTGCHRCGRAATFRRPHTYIDPTARYHAPHAGVRTFAPIATPDLLTLLDDENLGFVVATDTGGLDGAVADRGAVYRKDTHELVATLYPDSNVLKVRFLSVVDSDLMAGAGVGLGVLFSGYLQAAMLCGVLVGENRNPETKVVDWASFWVVPAIGVLGCMVLFVLFFRMTPKARTAPPAA